MEVVVMVAYNDNNCQYFSDKDVSIICSEICDVQGTI